MNKGCNFCWILQIGYLVYIPKSKFENSNGNWKSTFPRVNKKPNTGGEQELAAKSKQLEPR